MAAQTSDNLMFLEQREMSKGKKITKLLKLNKKEIL